MIFLYLPGIIFRWILVRFLGPLEIPQGYLDDWLTN